MEELAAGRIEASAMKTKLCPFCWVLRVTGLRGGGEEGGGADDPREAETIE